MDLIRNRVTRGRCRTLIPVAFEADTWWHRSDEEVGYLERAVRLIRNPTSTVLDSVNEGLWSWGRPILPPDYADWTAEEDRRTWEKLRFERRERNRLGIFVQYQWIEIRMFRRSALASRYPPLPSWFAEWEVPMDFRAELPPVLAYYGFTLMRDPNSRLWNVFKAEWVAITCKRWIWASVAGRLYLMPNKLLWYWEHLDMPIVTGISQDDLLGLIKIHNAVMWGEVPAAQGPSRPRFRMHSPGRGYDAGIASRGVFVEFDYEQFAVTQEEFLRPAARRGVRRRDDGLGRAAGASPFENRGRQASPRRRSGPARFGGYPEEEFANTHRRSLEGRPMVGERRVREPDGRERDALARPEPMEVDRRAGADELEEPSRKRQAAGGADVDGGDNPGSRPANPVKVPASEPSPSGTTTAAEPVSDVPSDKARGPSGNTADAAPSEPLPDEEYVEE